MKILNITIENFMSIGEATIQLSDRGLVLVQGENRDDTSASSNGAGKSTIADALCWSLYGYTSRGETGDAVINDKAGKNCRVTVHLEDDNNNYWVTRHRKHKTGKNGLTLVQTAMPSGLITDLTKGVEKLTQIEVEKVMGCSMDVFKASIVAGQESMPDLPGMTDKNLKQIVEEAAGVTVLESAYEEARRRLNLAKANWQSIGTMRDQAMERASDAEENCLKMEESRVEWTEERDARLAIARQAHADYVKDEEARCAVVHAARLLRDIDADIKAQGDKLNAVAGEQTAERQLVAKLSAAEREEASLRSTLTSLKDSYGRAKSGVDDVDHKLNCPCDECGRPLTAAELAPTKENLKRRALAVKTEHDVTLTLALKAVETRKQAQATLDAHRASMTDTSATSATLATLQAERRHVELLENEYQQAASNTTRALMKTHEIAAEVNPFAKKVLEAVEQKKNRDEMVAAVELDLGVAVKAHTLCEAVAQVFSPAGARGAILEEVTPYLNDQTAKYLGTLSDGNINATWTTITLTAKGEAREKFGIEVENAKGGKSFGLLSGGEKRKVRIAAALALQDLVATRASKQIELWIGDEIDDALDPAGLERLMMILDEKAKERGSVFVISHNELNSYISQTITVIKEGEVSRIEESTA